MTEPSNSFQHNLPPAVLQAVQRIVRAGFDDKCADANAQHLLYSAQQVDPEFMRKLFPKMDCFDR